MGRAQDSSCAAMPATFFEALASCIVKDSATGEDVFLNVICYDYDCDDVEPAITCGDNTSDPEAFVVANAFAVDSCGNLALKLRVCVAADAENASPQ